MRPAVLVFVFLGASIASPSHSIVKRVVGGEKAPSGKWPFMVSLRLLSKHMCGGALISTSWVVTAANCVYGLSPFAVSVVAGTSKLNSGGQHVAVSQIAVHPQYNPQSNINDIALLRLSDPLQKSPLIDNVTMETKNNDSVRNVTVIGWGLTSYPSLIFPNDLQFLDTKTIPVLNCTRILPNYPVGAQQICTLSPKEHGVCQGDAGGPLIDASNNVLIGVISWGVPCAKGNPDVYSRVSAFIDWIGENTGIKPT